MSGCSLVIPSKAFTPSSSLQSLILTYMEYLKKGNNTTTFPTGYVARVSSDSGVTVDTVETTPGGGITSRFTATYAKSGLASIQSITDFADDENETITIEWSLV